MVREPIAFLMDEPLSNLDAKLRVSMRSALARLHERLGVTTVYVTHDQVEAMTLGQRVAVLRDGRLQQVDTPQDALQRAGEPVRRRVHRLAVHEPGREPTSTTATIRFGGYTIAAAGRARRPARAVLIVGIRPTDFEHAGERRSERSRGFASGPTSSRSSAPSRT